MSSIQEVRNSQAIVLKRMSLHKLADMLLAWNSRKFSVEGDLDYAKTGIDD